MIIARAAAAQGDKETCAGNRRAASRMDDIVYGTDGSGEDGQVFCAVLEKQAGVAYFLFRNLP